MKRLLFGLMAIGLFPGFTLGGQHSAHVNFSGRWVLSMTRTKHMPLGLKACTMLVRQTGQQLEVRTEQKGNLRQRSRHTERPISRGGELPPGWTPSPQGEVPTPDPGGARYGIGGPPTERVPIIPGSSGHARPTQTITDMVYAAFAFYPRDADYNLDGSKSTVTFGREKRAAAKAWLRWSEGGRMLKLSIMGNAVPNDKFNFWKDIVLKDRWKLSKDGQTLFVKRTVRTPVGPSRLRLVFSREPSGGRPH